MPGWLQLRLRGTSSGGDDQGNTLREEDDGGNLHVQLLEDPEATISFEEANWDELIIQDEVEI